MPPRSVLILGGGLAGLAAAIVLVESGLRVTLVERKPFLGGRATSYPVPQSAEEYVDNCQHVLLRCCTNLIDFYGRLGVLENIRFQDRFYFLDHAGEMSELRGSFLPAPFHFLPSFLTFGLLSWRDKIAIASALMMMLRQQNRLSRLDNITMRQWLEDHGQTSGAIELFWRTVLVSALNEDLERTSARYGIKVFLDGFLNNAKAYHMGVPATDLGTLYTQPSLKLLSSGNGEVRMRSTISSLEADPSGVRAAILNDGTTLTADYFLSTLPPEALVRILPQSLLDLEYFSNMSRLESSPITAIYFWFDRDLTALPSIAFPGKQIQWLFNKGNGHVGLVISASRDLLELGRPEILELALYDLCSVLPHARHAKLLRSVVIKEPYATFSCKAGADLLRPDQKTPIPRFFVAGDWTATGWPPTMEGAVRSGYRSAELILQAEGIPKRILVPDYPVAALARLLGRQ